MKHWVRLGYSRQRAGAESPTQCHHTPPLLPCLMLGTSWSHQRVHLRTVVVFIVLQLTAISFPDKERTNKWEGGGPAITEHAEVAGGNPRQDPGRAHGCSCNLLFFRFHIQHMLKSPSTRRQSEATSLKHTA